MVKVIVYAYCISETSSRQIFKALQENVAFRVLAANNRPDHRTICRFRTQHAETLSGLFQQVLDMCKRDDLVPAKALALDGTKVKATASLAKNRTKEQLDKELRDYVEKVFAEAERKDKEEDELYGEENDGFSLPSAPARPQGAQGTYPRRAAPAEGRGREEEDRGGKESGRPTGERKGGGREGKEASRTEADR